jgi:hypothetical protein
MIDMTAVLGGIIGGMIYSVTLTMVHLARKKLEKRKIKKKHTVQRERIASKKKESIPPRKNKS